METVEILNYFKSYLNMTPKLVVTPSPPSVNNINPLENKFDLNYWRSYLNNV